jgi:hypothetical protein
VGVAATAVVTAAPTLLAQRAPTTVSLMVRPHVGDTLRLQVEQTVTMRSRRVAANVSTLGAAGTDRAARPDAARADSPPVGPRRDRAQVTRVQLFAHSLVESSDLQRTTLLATSDSIAMWSGAPGDPVAWRTMSLADENRQVRVQVTPDGAMRVADPPPGARELGVTLGSLPGLLPAMPVAVGSSWSRELPLPSLPLTGYHADGVLQVTLRLDSLTRGGRDAWISINGVLRRDGARRELPPGVRVITAGTMRGSMLVDRARAWIVDAMTAMDVQSEVVPGPAATAPPMLIDLRIEQRVRVR